MRFYSDPSGFARFHSCSTEGTGLADDGRVQEVGFRESLGFRDLRPLVVGTRSGSLGERAVDGP